eukprot:2460604-Pyramimonas_sp.AAC.1
MLGYFEIILRTSWAVFKLSWGFERQGTPSWELRVTHGSLEEEDQTPLDTLNRTARSVRRPMMPP